MARARNHIRVLEENMALLMEQAIANEWPVLSSTLPAAQSHRRQQSR